MITYLQAVVLGILQGVTELFPVSSLGHTVLLPGILDWPIDQHAEFFVIFLVATHLATALVLLGFFWEDWWNIALGFFRSLALRRIPSGDTYAKMAWLIIVATVPAGLLGLVFDKPLESLFGDPKLVAVFLVGNGLLLYGAEVLRRRRAVAGAGAHKVDEAIAHLSYLEALGIGAMQALALFPGFSRTGSALAGGLLARLNHESAARFAFLLATPLILAASVLELPKLLHSQQNGYPLGVVAVGFLVSAVAAYLSVRFLSRYFKQRTLVPFAIYCGIAGFIAFFLVR